MNESSTTNRIYRIRDWEKIYEVNRTRELKYLEWVPMSNRLDTDAYVRIAEHPNGEAHIGVWFVLVCIASRAEPRGVLIDASGNGHTAESLARQSRFKLQTMQEAIPRFIEVRLLEIVPSIVVVSTATEVVQVVNGKAQFPAQGFEAFWTRWVHMTGESAYERQARIKWGKCGADASLSAVMECLASYEASGKAERKHFMNPDHWLQTQAENAWKARWAPPAPEKKKAKSANVVEGLEQDVTEDLAKGRRPL